MIALSYCFSPAGRMVFQKFLIDSGITVLYDEYLEDKSPHEFDYKLFDENDFENQSEKEVPDDNNDESNISNDNSEAISLREDPNNNPKWNESEKLNSSKIWVFPEKLMKKESSILYENEPWKIPNQNRSIDGQKLRYNHRPMSDLEFQFPPLHPILIEASLKEALQRLGYINEDIEFAVEAFYHWCTHQIGENGLNIANLYKLGSVREMWEKIRANFSGIEGTKSPLAKGYILLSDLALTFISCSASEAQCERYISSQKLCLSKNIRNINDDYLKALWLLYSHRSNILKNLYQ